MLGLLGISGFFFLNLIWDFKKLVNISKKKKRKKEGENFSNLYIF